MSVNMRDEIAETLHDMIRQNGVDNITLKDLVGNCSVSRQTFYYHFRDIMDVMEYYIRRMCEKILEESIGKETPVEALEVFVIAALDNHDMLESLYNSQRRDELERILVDAVKKYLRGMVLSKAPGLSINYMDMEAALSFYTYGIVGVLLAYGRNPVMDSRELAKQLVGFMAGGLRQFKQKEA